MQRLKREIAILYRSHRVRKSEIRELIVSGWVMTVYSIIDVEPLTEAHEERLLAIVDEFDLKQNELDSDGAWSKLVKSGVLRDIAQGIASCRIRIGGELPFNLQAGEHLIWVFKDVEMYEERIVTSSSRLGFDGLSVSFGMGVYFKAGSFEKPIAVNKERALRAEGLMAVTNRHLYFDGGESCLFRTRLDDIFSVQAYRDGIEIRTDERGDLSQAFRTGDGWFAYNIVKNANKVETQPSETKSKSLQRQLTIA